MTWLHAETVAFLERSHQARIEFRRRHPFYHEDDFEFLRRMVKPDSRVLVVGGCVEFISRPLPCQALYVLDFDPLEHRTAAAHIHPIATLAEAFQDGPIDVIFLPYTLQLLEDIQNFLQDLHQGVTPQTRIVIIQYNFLWAPLIRLTQKFALKTSAADLNWLNRQDVINMLELTGFQAITAGMRCLVPFRLLGLGPWLNTYAGSLPGISWLSQKSYVIARSVSTPTHGSPGQSVSVLIPARNEAGNIRPLLNRLPVLGTRCEVIFVEGHSQDKTWEEILRQIKEHERRDLFEFKTMQQTQKGKADAVRLGFSQATGDILIILDADISVQPEDLVHFYAALNDNTAEFLNGSRLVYKMERDAMQILNLFFNKLFAVILSWLIGQRVKDTLCGTKAISRKNYERIRLQHQTLGALDPFGDFELLLGASCLNLKIRDVPVRYKQRVYGSTNISRFKNGWELLTVVWRAWSEMKR